MLQETYNKIEKITGSDSIIKSADMSHFTSFRAGGKADLLVSPNSIQQLIDVIKALDETPYIIGNGTNVLVSDGGYPGVIVKIGSGISKIEINGDEITSETGILLATLANEALKHELAGLEFAAGIPGSLGGALFMNAGAYDGEMKQVVEWVDVFDMKTKKEERMSSEMMEFSYRKSALTGTDKIALRACMKLKKDTKEEIKKRMDDMQERRKSKQPLNYPSAGSFFKRPKGYYAGQLIQEAGLKGRRVGGASVSTLHAGFIINDNNATATDIIKLMEIVKEEVYKNSKVHLETEVRIIGK